MAEGKGDDGQKLLRRALTFVYKVQPARESRATHAAAHLWHRTRAQALKERLATLTPNPQPLTPNP